jgi:hypothetical protein
MKFDGRQLHVHDLIVAQERHLEIFFIIFTIFFPSSTSNAIIFVPLHFRGSRDSPTPPNISRPRQLYHLHLFFPFTTTFSIEITNNFQPHQITNILIYPKWTWRKSPRRSRLSRRTAITFPSNSFPRKPPWVPRTFAPVSIACRVPSVLSS